MVIAIKKFNTNPRCKTPKFLIVSLKGVLRNLVWLKCTWQLGIILKKHWDYALNTLKSEGYKKEGV
jgi:hypothetical protein